MLTHYRTAAVMMLMLATPLAVSAEVAESRQEAASVDPYAGFNGRYVADRTQAVQPRTRIVQSRVTYVNRSSQQQRTAYASDTRAKVVRNPAYYQTVTTYVQVDEPNNYAGYVQTPSEPHEEYAIPSRTSYRGSYYSSPRSYISYRSYGYYGGYPSYGYSRHHGGHYGHGSYYGHRRHSFSYGVSYGHYGGHHSGYRHHYGGHHGGSGVSIYFRF